MASYSIRSATLRDAKTIASIHSSVSEALEAKLVPAEFFKPQSIDASLTFWREAIEYAEPQVQVAVTDDNTIVGFVGYDRSRDQGSKPTVGEIWAIYVLPAYWSTGAGLALWDAARDGLIEEGCTKVTAWVPLAYERALRFHDMAGFKREMTTIKTVLVGLTRIEEIRFKRDLK